MAEVPGTLEGWYVLHDFRRIDWPAWQQLSSGERSAAIEEANAFLKAAESVGEGSSAFYSILGHKSDLLWLHLRPRLEQLSALERGFAQTKLGALTSRPYSYLSVTELSLYEASARGGSQDPKELAKNPFVQKRLRPQIPEMPYLCFYPMNKRRGEMVNWYTAGIEERRQMMQQHGATGHKYRDQVIQMITGSMGLDDWEWGVTLFGLDPLAIKKLVYEMRFDVVSAKYAEFGPFQVGVRIPPANLGEYLNGPAV